MVSIVFPEIKTKIACIAPAPLHTILTLAVKMPEPELLCPLKVYPSVQSGRLSFLPEADLSELLLHWFTGADTLKADGPQTVRTGGLQNCGFTAEAECLQTESDVNPRQLKPNACKSGHPGQVLS